MWSGIDLGDSRMCVHWKIACGSMGKSHRIVNLRTVNVSDMR